MIDTKQHRVALWCLVLLLFTLGGIFMSRWAESTNIGSSDFNAYWAAARLFLQGRNPCDANNMLEMEQAHFNPDRHWAMMVWNPPTLWVFLLPLAWMPFQVARVVWLLTNVVLVLVSCFMLQRVYFPTRQVWVLVVYCLVVSSFSSVLITIIAGQVTFLVLFGLAASLFLMKREQWFLAGVALILTTPKPHLVMLALPYLMLYMALQRRWSWWLGLGTAGVVCALLLFALRPTWIVDYSAYLSIPPTNWATPTLGGVLKSHGVGEWVQYAGFGFLVMLPFFLQRPDVFSPESVVGLLTLVTIPNTFFGWSYDQSLLLLPIAQIMYWLSAPKSSLIGRLVVSVLIAIVLVASTGHRVVAKSEIEFFWIPLSWAGIYALTWAMTGGLRLVCEVVGQ